MMAQAWFSLPPPDKWGDFLIRCLAVVAVFFVGGWLTGFLFQRLTRLLTTKKVYPSLLWLMRTVGGVTLAWLSLYLIFGTGGGWGLGGLGGTGPGQGEGTGNPEAPHSGDNGRKKDGGEGPARVEQLPPARETVLRVEVLALTADDLPIRDDRFYRIEGEQQRQSLEEVRERIYQRKAAKPPLEKVEIVLYKNSPDRSNPAVEKLRSVVKSQGLETAITEVEAKAPRAT
jgi:hypothetical protein